MEHKNQKNLQFLGFDIIDVKFQSYKPFDFNEKLEISIDPQAFLPEDSKTNFQILMRVILKNEEYFNLGLSMIGHFNVPDKVSKDNRMSFINVNAPAIMFPYVRAFISTFTSNLGNAVGTLNIPPQFFSGQVLINKEEKSPFKKGIKKSGQSKNSEIK